MSSSFRSLSMNSQRSRPSIKKPKKVIKKDGKMARQMLMGMALGCHMMEKVFWNVYFTIKSRIEAQILFVVMGPVLAVPLACLLIPLACMGVVGMILAGITSNMERFTHLQTVMDRRQFNMVKRQSSMHLKSTMNLNASGDTTSTQLKSGLSRVRFAAAAKKSPPPRSASSMTPLAPRARTGRRAPTRSQTFTFGTQSRQA